jgi:hypothetical protein
MAGGDYHVKLTNVGSFPGVQDVRISWTVGAAGMYFLYIDANGNWTNYYTSGTEGYCSPHYDCSASVEVYLNKDKTGCHNPSGSNTVWANCRMTNPL